MYIIDLRCECGHTASNVTFNSYEEFKSDGFECECCGKPMERSWNGQSAGLKFGRGFYNTGGY